MINQNRTYSRPRRQAGPAQKTISSVPHPAGTQQVWKKCRTCSKPVDPDEYKGSVPYHMDCAPVIIGKANTGLISAVPLEIPAHIRAAIDASPPPPLVVVHEPRVVVEPQPSPAAAQALQAPAFVPIPRDPPILEEKTPSLRWVETKTDPAAEPLFSLHHTKKPHAPVSKTFDTENWLGFVSSEKATVDSNVAAVVTAELVGKERTGTGGRTTYASAVALSRKYHSNLTGLSGPELAASISNTAAAAFADGFDAEIRAAQHILAVQEEKGETLALYKAGSRPPPGLRFKIYIKRQLARLNAWYWSKILFFIFLAYVPLILTTIWAITPRVFETTCPPPLRPTLNTWTWSEWYAWTRTPPYTWKAWFAALPSQMAQVGKTNLAYGRQLLHYYREMTSWSIHETAVAWHLTDPCPLRVSPSFLTAILLWTALLKMITVLWQRYYFVADPDQAVISQIAQTFNETNLGTAFPPGVFHGKLAILKKEYDLIQNVAAVTKLGSTDIGRKTFIAHLSLVPHRIFPFVPNSSGRNELVCIEKRLCNHPIKPDAGDLNAFSRFLPTFLDFVFPDLNGCPKHQYAREANLAGDAHMAVYNEWNSPARVGTAMAKLHDEDRRKQQAGIRAQGDYDVTCFVKAEPSFSSDDTTCHEPSAPRPIQNASGAAHVSLGPYMYAFSKLMAARLNPDYWITYASGISVQQASDIIRGSTYYVGDVSRFDRGIQQETLKALNDWRDSKNMFSHTARKFVESQLATKGVTMKGRHIYKLKGQRRSGDDNTSVDNSLLNAAAHAHAIMLHTGLTLTQVSKKYRILMLGDDIVIIGPPELAHIDFKRILAGIAWMIKPAFTTETSAVEFCSRINWPSSAGHTFGTKAGRLLLRFGYSWDPTAPVDVGAKAYALLLANNHVPFVAPFLRRVLELHPKPKSTWVLPEWSMTNPEVMVSATEDTYTAFTARYGLSRDDEENFVKELRQWKGGPAVISSPAIDRMIEVDGYPG